MGLNLRMRRQIAGQEEVQAGHHCYPSYPLLRLQIRRCLEAVSRSITTSNSRLTNHYTTHLNITTTKTTGCKATTIAKVTRFVRAQLDAASEDDGNGNEVSPHQEGHRQQPVY